ncbi:dimethyladenosine transferase, putative [Plasmodium knowlesi strain H]|uniref:rRNA adenine N(6)-methyltransferase n=3 Tax=Plasmodium knowlesi TaxID=5850 RepID=A0A5K1VDP5_PLAKH|nr:ribosomal RNA small subunit methyltransferase A2, putative [Plasmodium knowlesi strain H]OTN63886.1 rRNA adenine N(6)-methyltransferase [Plasmodium knowlesi]CAA9991296.1 ribosomal RNA small subunit methyltransferase A2, putative [Plasmodium knowlesi strain H]SBO26395.1 dimethyladenosine transferase, putative [Plasmodium knowlesi strain H]SBO28997.1 dimethyladenosine transferase, putative [Plasmodium knowlesi strain H]VVS80770.1 ribosomal RNA small subunit methyltransferase A2, putative [Pla|eukprot:XP_002262575.1 dimethyladenosine transferase, putative [Plasmodium knowlesi strain H]
MNKGGVRLTICIFIFFRIKCFLFKEINHALTHLLKPRCGFATASTTRKNRQIPIQYIHTAWPSHRLQCKKGQPYRGKRENNSTPYNPPFCKEHSPNEELQDNSPHMGDSHNEGENKFIGRTFEGITIYPLQQPDEDRNILRTKIPSREFKPKRSLGQNYLKDENIIQKMISAIELDADEFYMKDNRVGSNQGGGTKKAKGKGKKKCKGPKNRTEHGTRDDSNGGVAKEDGNTANTDNPITMQDNYPANSDGSTTRSANKTCSFQSVRDQGKGIIELGCGLGQISKFLFAKYKKMTAVEIDSRALSVLSRTMPGFDFIHDDVLQINYKDLSKSKGTKLTVIGNLPFYITSQILFCLLDYHHYIEQAIVTIQYEVGQRIISKPNEKNYSILSILFNLYTNPYLLFKIPSSAFYPVPKVEAAVMKIIFKHSNLNCNLLFLKEILRHSFQQRRKKLKSSLKRLLAKYSTEGNLQLPSSFCDLRPQQLTPLQFVELTNFLFPLSSYPFDPTMQTKVWRKKKHGD